MKTVMNKLKIFVFALTLLYCTACGSSGTEASSQTDFSKLKADNIVIDGKIISMFDTDEELEKQLGDAYASDTSAVSNKIEKKTIIMKVDEGEKHGMTYRSLQICNPEYRGELFAAFNGVTGKSSAEEVKEILGDNCIEVETSNNDDFYCYFVDGKEIDYSEVKIPEGFVDTLGTCPYGRAYCEDFVSEGSADYYIEWKFFELRNQYYDCICTLYQKS